MIRLTWFSRSQAEEAAELAALPAGARRLSAEIALSGCELQSRTDDLRQRASRAKVGSDSSWAPEALALFDQSLYLLRGHRCYDTQFLAAGALVRGHIAEMATGEGKTVVTGLAAFTLSLNGRGVHVATENRYLAERDADFFRRLLEPLGITVGLISEGQTPAQKQQAYDCDITCGPGYEFGFDYLRDQITRNSRKTVRLGDDLIAKLSGKAKSGRTTFQRGLATAIIDEIDSVLIDDACSPLLIATPDFQSSSPVLYQLADGIAGKLVENEDFKLEGSQLALTETGRQRCYELAGDFNPDQLLRPWSEYVLNALRARHLMRRDVHYVVSQGNIAIVDRTTGRIFDQRTWRSGLHQAIQVREGVAVTSEHRTSATITKQRYFRLYPHLCGTTGTAKESEREFRELFQLPITTIPLRLPSQRTMLPPLIYPTKVQKWEAVVREIQKAQPTGQPTLVGTSSIGDSQALSELLAQNGVKHTVLNGVQSQAEAEIIAQAGQPGAITVATNMAGRGTDIKLHPDAVRQGGLYVIGTEFHESTRTDRQLIGRAARQGDPGVARFLCSAEDHLWTLSPAHRLPIRTSLHHKEHTDSGSPVNPRWIHALQQRMERTRFQQRKAVLEQDRRRESLTIELSPTAST